MTEDTAALVERVRQQCIDPSIEQNDDALAALDSLTAALERAERELQEQYAAVQHASDLQDEAEARAQKAEEELCDVIDEKFPGRLQKAEAVVEAAREALRLLVHLRKAEDIPYTHRSGAEDGLERTLAALDEQEQA